MVEFTASQEKYRGIEKSMTFTKNNIWRIETYNLSRKYDLGQHSLLPDSRFYIIIP